MIRDRVISGLARGVIVVQAAQQSGSMDTAKRAQKQGRLVFAVRGGGEGAEELIRDGASVIDADALDWDAMVALLDGRRADPKQGEGQMQLL